MLVALKLGDYERHSRLGGLAVITIGVPELLAFEPNLAVAM